jgi:uncharacterized Tic20 family protein
VRIEKPTILRLALYASIHSSSVQEQHDAAGLEFKARYRFPVRYKICAADGDLLREGYAAMDWNAGERRVYQESADSSRATVTLESKILQFRVAQPGTLQVEVEVDSDSDYSASAEELSLRVYQNAANFLGPLLLWFALASVGIVLLGIALFTGLISLSRQSAEAQAISSDSQARQMAACCHAAGVIGFIFPFGNVLAPLLLWLLQRETHAFIDLQGKEAVNFQISFAIYYLLSFVLMFVLLGFLLFPLVLLAHLILMTIATVKSYNGEEYRYPFTIRMIS